MKVVVIGIDGGTFKVINPLIDKGLLPNLKYLIKNGASGELISTFPPVTPCAWGSLITGKNPGKHGFFDFFASPAYGHDRSVLNASWLKSKAIWQLLSENGKKVGIVNVPMTYPPDKVNGFIIPGVQFGLAPTKNFSYPPELLQELQESIGDYKFPFVDGLSSSCCASRLDRVLEELRNMAKIREQAIAYLMQHHDWDLFMGVFFYIDQIQHHFWKFYDRSHPKYRQSQYEGVIPEFYKYVDDAIGNILNKLSGDTQILVISDHGAGPIYKLFYMNTWLKEQGYLMFKKKYFPLWRYKLPHLVYKILKKIKVKAVEWALPLSLIPSYGNLVDPREGLMVNEIIDWKKTVAYSGTPSEQGIYINLRGRDPEGIVEPGTEYERLREEIMEKLHELKDPDTGERINTHIWKKEEIYSGPYVNLAPDILLKMNDGTYNIWDDIHKQQLFNQTDMFSGGHRSEGIFIIKGPGIKSGITLNNLNVLDITPTILYMMGFNAPKDMDGRVILESFEESVRNRKLFKNLSADISKDHKNRNIFYTKKEEEKIKERLRSLGYV